MRNLQVALEDMAADLSGPELKLPIMSMMQMRLTSCSQVACFNSWNNGYGRSAYNDCPHYADIPDRIDSSPSPNRNGASSSPRRPTNQVQRRSGVSCARLIGTSSPPSGCSTSYPDAPSPVVHFVGVVVSMRRPRSVHGRHQQLPAAASSSRPCDFASV
jgi:hypothetical protein